MNDDAALLRRYVEEGSETAFAELVQRHLDLVYGAALRRTGGHTHDAADVAQQVFTTLARRAEQLSRHTVLSAWLHTATRNAALNLMISEQRRRLREADAGTTEAAAEAASEWGQVRPVLDAAIDELPESDRTAVILRFLERHSFAQIGAALRVTEDAARMRTERALEKLRASLARRGITSTGAALASLVTTQPLVSAPAGLASTLAAQSLAGAGVATGAFALASFMTAKLLATVTVSAVAAFGLGLYTGIRHINELPPPPPAEMPHHSQTIAALRDENRTLAAEVARLQAANAALSRPPPAPPPPAAPVQPAVATASSQELPLGQVQRRMLNNLRQIAAARDQFRLEHGRAPSSVHELVGENKYIRRLLPIDGEDYSTLAMAPTAPLVVTTPNGVTVTYDPAGAKTTRPVQTPAMAHAAALGKEIGPSANRAIEAYRAANGGKDPTNELALISYFSTPQEGAAFLEFLQAQAEAQAESRR